jgi:hypothetical protein
MATTTSSETPTSANGDVVGLDAARRRLRDTVNTGLAEPLAEIVRTLQRLTLAHLESDGEGLLDAHLLGRARSLAHGLQQVVDEIVANGEQAGALDGRECQETVFVSAAIDSAASYARDVLGDRNVVVRCAPHAAIVTNPLRFQDLLVTLLAGTAAAADDDVRITAERGRGELLLEIDTARIATETLDRIRRVARSLGGSVQLTASGTAVCVWLPQQRTGDSVAAE